VVGLREEINSACPHEDKAWRATSLIDGFAKATKNRKSKKKVRIGHFVDTDFAASFTSDVGLHETSARNQIVVNCRYRQISRSIARARRSVWIKPGSAPTQKKLHLLNRGATDEARSVAGPRWPHTACRTMPESPPLTRAQPGQQCRTRWTLLHVEQRRKKHNYRPSVMKEGGVCAL